MYYTIFVVKKDCENNRTRFSPGGCCVEGGMKKSRFLTSMSRVISETVQATENDLELL